VRDKPSEVVTGIRRIFSVPTVYRFAQWLVGADRFRKVLIEDFLQVETGMKLVDIGCGPADILKYLPDVDYVGLDHSRSYVDSAIARFGSRGQFIQITAGEIDLIQFAPRDLAISIGVLHHLNDGEALEMLKMAKAVLGENGRFVSVDPTIAVGQHPIGRFLASRDRGQHVRAPNSIEALVKQVFGKVTVHTRHNLLRIPYSHVLVEAC